MMYYSNTVLYFAWVAGADLWYRAAGRMETLLLCSAAGSLQLPASGMSGCTVKEGLGDHARAGDTCSTMTGK